MPTYCFFPHFQEFPSICTHYPKSLHFPSIIYSAIILVCMILENTTQMICLNPEYSARTYFIYTVCPLSLYLCLYSIKTVGLINY